MYKRKDNDIFGTANIGFAPKITNDIDIDPNSDFKSKIELNYSRYVNTLTNYNHEITAWPTDMGKVNENANFEENFHKKRKENDLQSSIFYAPIEYSKPKEDLIENKIQERRNTFGKKETINREINNLPYNEKKTNKNESKLFDLDERIDTSKVEERIPLIPNKIQWNEHDSIRYGRINVVKQTLKEQRENKFEDISESTSVVEQIENVEIETRHNEEKMKKNLEINEEELEENTIKKKSIKRNEIKKNFIKRNIQSAITVAKKEEEYIQIEIVRGWQDQMLEGLIKVSKLNNTPIIKFDFSQDGKGTVSLKKNCRWENIADWFRKEAKLKIKIIDAF